MVGVLIRMKLTMLRRALPGRRRATCSPARRSASPPRSPRSRSRRSRPTRRTLRDLLAVVFAIVDARLDAGAGLRRRAGAARRALRAAADPARAGSRSALLGAAFVGVGDRGHARRVHRPVVFAARLGAVPVAARAARASCCSSRSSWSCRGSPRGFGALSRSRAGGAVSALITAVMLVAASSGWIVFVALDAVLDDRVLGRLLHRAPSAARRAGRLLAVEARRSPLLRCSAWPRWWRCSCCAWTRALGPPRLARAVVRGLRRRAPRGRLGVPQGAAELVARSGAAAERVVAPVFAVLTCLVPLAFDSTAFLPFVGALIALMGAVMATNLYGQDGTALWLTLLTPGSERPDVRGRQLAWLAVFGPMAVLIGAAISAAPAYGHGGDRRAARRRRRAAAAGRASTQLVPGPDPREHSDSPLDHGDLTGPGVRDADPAPTAAGRSARVGGVALAGAPGLASSACSPASSPRSGSAARRQARLRERGPELLHLMRSGKPPGDASPTRRPRACWTAASALGMIALFPQAIVPAVMKLIRRRRAGVVPRALRAGAVAVADDRVHGAARDRRAGPRHARLRSRALSGATAGTSVASASDCSTMTHPRRRATTWSAPEMTWLASIAKCRGSARNSAYSSPVSLIVAPHAIMPHSHRNGVGAWSAASMPASR